ncbi:hypothetical protein [Leucobacter sp. NPDC077196]|uniref:hypothetical protein n=1 Tax=Leucobacter sp. NPDC077196 TaxID=3154959 RepID=UPI00344544A7
MATTTKTTKPTEVVEYDFDSWDDAAEKKALVALAPDVKYIIVEGTFIGRFPDGVIVKLPLSISLDDIDAMTKNTPNPVDQVKNLLRTVASEDEVAEFTKHDMTETIVMAEKFFTVFSRIAQAALPES